MPGLFCATAQIRFPAGVRREETGKAVMAQAHPDDFPMRCDEPIAGEDLTWVLYGSGGCSLYDASMLRALGGIDEAYAPAYVEDLDVGYRAWQRGWPTVFVAGAVVEHRHRATTSRYYTEERLAEILEINYLRFLTRAVAHGPLFRKLWKQATGRLPPPRRPQLGDRSQQRRRSRWQPKRDLPGHHGSDVYPDDRQFSGHLPGRHQRDGDSDLARISDANVVGAFSYERSRRNAVDRDRHAQGPAPAGGATVSLSSSNVAVATVPATVNIPAGATSGSFTITTLAQTSSTSATISAAYHGLTKAQCWP